MLRDRDYIMRMVREFARFLAKIISRRAEVGEERTLDDLDDLARSYTGLGIDLLERMPAGQIINLLSMGGQLDVNRAYAAGRLLEERSLLAAEAGNAELAASCADSALQLLQACHADFGEYLNEEHEHSIERLRDGLLGPSAQ